jgi:hypothetical protein
MNISDLVKNWKKEESPKFVNNYRQKSIDLP